MFPAAAPTGHSQIPNYIDQDGNVDIIIEKADPVCTFNPYDVPYDTTRTQPQVPAWVSWVKPSAGWISL